MKEQDYINATNLAKCRIALTTLRDTVFDDAINEKLKEISTMTICKMVEMLREEVDSND